MVSTYANSFSFQCLCFKGLQPLFFFMYSYYGYLFLLPIFVSVIYIHSRSKLALNTTIQGGVFS
jgi:hypothetical protein